MTELPARLGTSCYPLLIPPYGAADPVAVWSNLHRPEKVGASGYFGSPIPDPAKAPTTFLDLPVGDTERLPPGTRVTLQGVIHNPAASSPREASLTNPVLLRFR
jgi:hypothetical protein